MSWYLGHPSVVAFDVAYQWKCEFCDQSTITAWLKTHELKLEDEEKTHLLKQEKYGFSYNYLSKNSSFSNLRACA